MTTTTTTTPPSADLFGRTDWISTFSGLPFFPLAPRAEDVRIEDIAHALAHLCRFAGHTTAFYSVAQHSMLVSHLCSPVDALWGLLHDASEAYLSDVVSPVKRATGLDGYRVIEHRVQRAVAARFGLALDEPASVKSADRALLRVEQRDLMRMPAGWHERRLVTQEVKPAVGRIVPLGSAEAKTQFLSRFFELTAR